MHKRKPNVLKNFIIKRGKNENTVPLNSATLSHLKPDWSSAEAEDLVNLYRRPPTNSALIINVGKIVLNTNFYDTIKFSILNFAFVPDEHFVYQYSVHAKNKKEVKCCLFKKKTLWQL